MTNVSPAEKAAQKSLEDIYACIQNNESFILEAGAGAGKTYSLNKALSYILETKGYELSRFNQRVACITYTNVAADNFLATQNNHTALFSGTIHSFCWDLIKRFQVQLRDFVLNHAKLSALLEEGEDIRFFKIDYDFGFRGKENFIIKIHHDDVIEFTVALLENNKFLNFLYSKFPIIFIDEYQDTNTKLMEAIVLKVINSGSKIMFGFFGDGWQKIYGEGYGELTSDTLKVIKKQSNFRSEKNIVETLNRIRPNLQQEIVDPSSSGSIRVYTANNWTGNWEKRNHWQGALPPDEAKERLRRVREILVDEENWDFDSENSKTLMLTHKVLAIEQGYEDIVSIFRYNDSFIKKQDKHIAYFLDTIEPLRKLYEEGNYGEMFVLLGRKFPHIKSISDKKEWSESLDSLFDKCDTGTVRDVLDHLIEFGKPILDSGVFKKENEIKKLLGDGIELSSSQEAIQKLWDIPYAQVQALSKFVAGYTPFSTQHGVKGDEFENVLVVLGRGWNNYDWDKFLMLSHPDSEITDGDRIFYERNRNLFYVACSRPIKNLTILFTQRLSDLALETLDLWFGSEKITHW